MDYCLPSNSFHGVLRRRVAALSIRVHRAGRREGPHVIWPAIPATLAQSGRSSMLAAKNILAGS